jgi:hypothetical protein
MGFLNGCTFLAPFMPIECYSGWLQDGSFGGPSAEGVDKYNGSQQICTWRKYLGGNQYGNGFPTFLGEWLGLGSVPWIWRNCPGRVLEGISAKLGDAQTRRLIMEYRAKQALLDMKKWSNAFKSLLNNNFGTSIGPEWSPYWIDCDVWKATPYAKTSNNGSGLLTPEARTTPGWSGANQIPLTVSGNSATVDFQPIGANMTCQLCYRASDGTPVYSTPVSSGACSLRLDKAPGKGVVIAVICNTDYKYLGDTTRKTHFDYRLKLGTGVTGAADIYTKWYDVNLTSEVHPEHKQADMGTPSVAARAGLIDGFNSMVIQYDVQSDGPVSFGVFSPLGVLIKRQSAGYKRPGHYTECIDAGSAFATGMYIVKIAAGRNSFVAKTAMTK